jgi:hypothetical protein
VIIDRKAALNDVERDAAFAIFYAVGSPTADMERDGYEGGVVEWAEKNYPTELAMLIAGFTGCITGCLNSMEKLYGD